jgi:hypothetical protein
MAYIDVMLCVNDPDNGSHTGRVDGVDLHDDDIAMSLRGQSLKCTLVGGVLRIGHVTVEAITYQTWVGNWCWDCAKVQLSDAARIVNYLRRRKWDCEQGYTHLYEAFEAGKDINADDLAYVTEAEVAN